MLFSDARWVCELLKCAEHSMFLLLMHIVCNFWGNIFAENAGMCLWMKLHLTSCLSYCRLVHICRILRRAQKRVADKIVTSSGEETFFEPNIDIDTLYWAQKYWHLTLGARFEAGDLICVSCLQKMSTYETKFDLSSSSIEIELQQWDI